MKRILIADSGSTKTDWAVGALRFRTQGINPVHQGEADILRILQEELLPQVMASGPVDAIRFFGSGVRPDLEMPMQHLLQRVFPDVHAIEAKSDLLGAARALCGQGEGLACILGTGANSCLYDGERIVKNTPPLGYILGDEGSGAVLGKLFLNALYKNRLHESAQADFEVFSGLKMPQVIDRVYRQPQANRWLASLSECIHGQLHHDEVRRLVTGNFRDFIRHNVNPYGRRDLPLSAVGSIAFFFREQLEEAADEEGYAVGKILRSPIDGLVEMEELG